MLSKTANYCIECGRELEDWEKTICSDCEEKFQNS